MSNNDRVVLSTHDLRKAFGGLVVANGINFSVKHHEVRCIIGPNGAGKTTFFNMLSGLLPLDSGEVRIEDVNVTHMPAYRRQKLGLNRTFQAPHIFPEMSVFENVLLAYRSRFRETSLLTKLKVKLEEKDAVEQALLNTHIQQYSGREAGSLSHGEKKRVEMAMGIVQRPKVLLMDEPTAGMTVRETQEIAELIKEIRKDMAIVIVEHDMEFVREIADKITVLYRGDLVREGSLEELENDSFIQEIYLGSVEI